MNRIIKTKQMAFTLIELLVVIAIIGILSGLIITTMSGATESARIAKLKVYSNSVRDTLGANLVSEWKFDELATAVSGTSIRDTWGTNTGTLLSVGDPAVNKISTACASDKCLFFDGADDYVDVGNNLLGSSYTITGWFKASAFRSSGDIDHAIFSQYEGIPAGRFIFECRYVNGLVKIDAFEGSGAGHIAGTTSISTNTWYFAGITNNNKSIILYLNGVIENTATFTHNPQPVDNYIGTYTSVGGGAFNGLIDDVRIYSAAIPSAQIRENYLAGLNKLLANNGITKAEYNNRISELNENVAEK